MAFNVRASIVGYITLFGIARNSIILVSHTKHLETHECVNAFITAVTKGATERLVPILMTAIAARLALVPIAMWMGRPGGKLALISLVLLFALLVRPCST